MPRALPRLVRLPDDRGDSFIALADLVAIETGTAYRGRYFLLMGRLSPLDGIGPEELGLEQLASQLDEPEIQELIIATNPSVEGEATAYYLAEMARARNVRVTRIAHGVPGPVNAEMGAGHGPGARPCPAACGGPRLGAVLTSWAGRGRGR